MVRSFKDPEASDSAMLRSFNLKNFRCFQHFTLEPLERVNLIAGKNNVGKTSLLEAIFIFLNPSNLELLFQVNRLRDMSRNGRFEDIEKIRGFFFDQDLDKVIELSGLEENNVQRSLQIRLAESEEFQREQLTLFNDNTVPFKPNESLTTEVGTYDTLVLEYRDPNRKKGTSRIFLRADGRLLARYRRERFPLGIYLTNSTRSPREDAERFSNLERVGRQWVS
jgi:hypothetical protein